MALPNVEETDESLRLFMTKLNELTSTEAGRVFYDNTLGTIALFKYDSDYMNQVQGEAARLRTHANWIDNPLATIRDDALNQQEVKMAATQLINYVKDYKKIHQQFFPQNENETQFCDELLNRLTNIADLGPGLGLHK